MEQLSIFGRGIFRSNKELFLLIGYKFDLKTIVNKIFLEKKAKQILFLKIKIYPNEYNTKMIPRKDKTIKSAFSFPGQVCEILTVFQFFTSLVRITC